MPTPAVARRVLDVPFDDEQKEAVFSVLREHDRVHNAGYWDAIHRPENEPQPLHVLATDEQRRIVGGLSGTTQLKWFHLEALAVPGGARRQGVGRRIVETAERVALVRGCRHVYADTMQHQAPDFFQRLGYAIVGRLEDWDSHGQTMFVLVKDLVPPPPD
jgi:GNAT superfamily N-acetyltransferase